MIPEVNAISLRHTQTLALVQRGGGTIRIGMGPMVPMRVIRNGMEPVSCMEFDLDTKLNQYKRINTIRQIKVEFRKDKSRI